MKPRVPNLKHTVDFYTVTAAAAANCNSRNTFIIMWRIPNSRGRLLLDLSLKSEREKKGLFIFRMQKTVKSRILFASNSFHPSF